MHLPSMLKKLNLGATRIYKIGIVLSGSNQSWAHNESRRQLGEGNLTCLCSLPARKVHHASGRASTVSPRATQFKAETGHQHIPTCRYTAAALLAFWSDGTQLKYNFQRGTPCARPALLTGRLNNKMLFRGQQGKRHIKAVS